MTPRVSLVAPIVLAALMLATTVHGAQRTFVASTGVDTNPCSLAAPCRSFDAAAAQTASAGEIIVLDSAGYGPVTITQSLSIIAPPGVYAGISVFAGSGIVISGASIEVALRGLTVNGLGGSVGVDVLDAARVRIEDTIVGGMGSHGIYIHAPARVVIANSRVRRNSSNGVFVFATLPNPAHVDIASSRIEENGDNGVYIDNNAFVVVRDSVLEENSLDGLRSFPDMGESVRVTLERTTISAKYDGGVRLLGNGGTVVIVSDCTIVNHATNGAFVFGFSSNWTVYTLQNNAIEQNVAVVAGGGGLTPSTLK